MRFRFKTRKLERLYYEEQGTASYPVSVVDAFFEVMAVIEASVDEREFYALKSLHYEKLTGKRGKKDQRSMRLNNQYRLILTLEQDDQGRYCYIIEISDHYKP